LAVTDWRLRRWRLWFLALSNAPQTRSYFILTNLRQNSLSAHSFTAEEIKKIGLKQNNKHILIFFFKKKKTFLEALVSKNIRRGKDHPILTNVQEIQGSNRLTCAKTFDIPLTIVRNMVISTY